MQFTVKKIKPFCIKDELLKIGFDPTHVDLGAKKHEFVNIKVQNLPFYCATIIKESALSSGADSAINREVLMHNVESSDLIISGTVKQLENIAKSLFNQPFGLKKVGEEILSNLKEKEYNPLIMGILNVTDDSFSDGSRFLDTKSAINHAKEMVQDGADIVDIGAQATNINSKGISPEDEIKRLKPLIKEIKAMNCLVSIDTRSAKVAEFSINEGADIINDVSFLNFDKNMINVIKNSDARYVLTHSKGEPSTMDNMCDYENLCDEIYESLKEKISFLVENGVSKDRLYADTGFGFAKNTEQNFELLNKIYEFNSLGIKTLAGVSRKRFLKSLEKNTALETLDTLTSLASFYLFENKVDIIRVHNVKQTKLALRLYRAIYSQKSCP